MSAHSYRETLKHRGLQPFLWTQFLGAFNDNFFKFVVTMVAVHTAVNEAASGRNVSLVGIVFVAPFLLFSGYAGQLADAFSKRTVLVVTKSLEIVATGLSLFAFASGRLELLYAVLFLIAVQATFFSPAKYGILPEMLPERDLSRANGVLEMSTFVAIVAGGAVATVVFEAWHDRLWLVGVTVVAIALVGFASSFGIPRVPAAAPATRIRINPWSDIALGVKDLLRDRVLLLTVVGLSYFWFLGGLLQSVMVLFGSEVLKLSDTWIGPLTASAAIGIGIGSLAAGRLSGDKVELGLAPIGAFGMGLSALGLSLCTHSAIAAAAMLTFVGFFGGLFAVPLNALLQQRGSAETKGRLMATNNFVNMIAVAMASGALWLCQSRLGMAPQHTIVVFAILTLVSSVAVLALVPEFFVRFCLWLLTHTIYRIRIVGADNVPFKGPALLVCNHMSHVDGFLIGSCVQRFIRFLVYRPYYEHWAFNRLLRMMHAIPISAGNRREMLASIERARQELVDGHVVCIFVEGSISRTGNLLPFKRGFERMAEGLDVPVIPVYLDRVWGSIFSYKGGKFFWKLPVRVPYPVIVAFGKPVAAPATAARTRLAMMELGCQVATVRRPATDTLAARFIRTAKRRWWSFSMADSSGRRLRFGNVLVAGLLLSRWLRRKAPAEQHIGLVLPASIGGALANIGTTLAGKVAVNLNFTIGREAMAAAVERAEIRTIITSRIFLKKASIEPMDGMVFLEDVMKEFGAVSKIVTLRDGLRAAGVGHLALARAARGHRRRPGGGDLLERQHGHPERRDALAPQHPVEHRFDRAGVRHHLEGRADRVAPVLPLVRLHGDAVVPAGRRLRGRLPPQPDGREDHRRAGRDPRRDDPDGHSDVLLGVHPQVRAAPVRRAPVRRRRRRAAARAGGAGVRREVRHPAARRLRLHGDVAGCGDQRARRERPRRAPGGLQGRLGRPPAARGRREGRGPRDRRRADLRPRRPAAGQRPELHARLPAATRSARAT